jgi:hypothetical protein
MIWLEISFDLIVEMVYRTATVGAAPPQIS